MPEGRFERTLRTVTRPTSRIYSPLFWRLLYGVAFSPPAEWIVGAGLRFIRAVLGDATAEATRDRLAKELVRSGWPHHGRNWRNLHASRFVWHAYLRSRRTVAPARQASQLRAERPLRVGVVGFLSRAFAFPRELFEAAPDEVELVFFDIPWATDFRAGYLRDVGAYSAYPIRATHRGSDIAALGRATTAAGLDVLLVLDERRDTYDLLDHVACPCVVDIALGAALLSHPSVAFHIHAEREADYFVVGDTMFCGTTRRPLGREVVFPGWVCYDPRGIDSSSRRPLPERDPLMLFHGALYKANSPAYLDVLFRLMHDDSDLEFVLMGHDWDGEVEGGALEPILARARNAGLAGRVHYDGEFHSVRDEQAATIVDPGWKRLRDHLDRARLAPNPWPVGGAASRVEAYLAGVPVPHLGVRTDPASWGRPQHGGGEIPILLLEETTTWSPEEYLELCRRVLYDQAFAEGVVEAQIAVAAHATDRGAYWGMVLDCYERWRARR